MVDLAREFGVSVFIYSSSQLVQNSFDDSTYNSDFFAGKLAVEKYIQSLDERSLGWMYVNTLKRICSSNGLCLRCRILRPAFFMEAFIGKPGPFVAGLLTVGLKPETKVHLTVQFPNLYSHATLRLANV